MRSVRQWMSENKDYTRSGLGTASDCVSMYSVHCRVIVDNRSEFYQKRKKTKKEKEKRNENKNKGNMRKHGKEASKGTPSPETAQKIDVFLKRKAFRNREAIEVEKNFEHPKKEKK